LTTSDDTTPAKGRQDAPQPVAGAPAPDAPDARPRRRPRRGRAGVVLIAAFAVIVLVAGLAFSGLTGRGLGAPEWAVERVEASINATLETGRVELGAIEIGLAPDFSPRAALRDVRLFHEDGQELIALPQVRAKLSGSAVMRREFRPRELELIGARLNLSRDRAGRFNLDLGPDAMGAGFAGNFGDLLRAMDRVLERPALAPIERITMERVAVVYDDAMQGRRWTLDGGAVVLRKDAARLVVDMEAPVLSDRGDAARLTLALEAERASSSARMSASLVGVPARDIAAQSRALSWLSVLDAPISGWLRAQTDASGEFAGLDGTLEIAAGAILPTPESKPVPFDEAKVYFTYETDAERLRLSEFSLRSKAVELVGEGQAYLSDLADTTAPSFLGQMRFNTLRLDPEGVFEQALDFSLGALDFRMSLAPFRMEVGQLVLSDAATRFQLNGDVSADDTGWDVALDATSPGMSAGQVAGYWPVDAIPKTRAWMGQNVHEGQLRNVFASLRAHQGQAWRTALSFDVEGGSIRFLKKMPPVTGLGGHLVIHDTALTAVANTGVLELESGARIEVGGSVFSIPDIAMKPAPADIQLRTTSSIAHALELIDHAPLHLLKTWDKGTDFATGEARMAVDLAFPLAEKIALEDVDYTATGTLHGVETDALVPGRRLAARELAVTLGDGALSIAGDATLDGVALFADWRQPTVTGSVGKSRVEGWIELSQRASDTFRLGLPKGSVSGRGRADFTIDIAPDTAPVLALRSDLNRVGLALDVLGWSKAQAMRGSLRVDATLGSVPRVTELRLAAGGLDLRGDVRFRQNGGLEALNFERLKVGNWLDVRGRLTGRGLSAPPGVTISSGRMVLSGLPARRASGARGAQSGPMEVSLDRLVVSSGLALHDFAGQFTGQGGFNGTFAGQVNGGTGVEGTLVPSPGGTAVRVKSSFAGEVLRDAGLFKSARGGEMDLRLVPTGQSGRYDGTLGVRQLTVRDAPALASLLSAASIVGILEQLTAEGLRFSDVQAEFRLNPDRVTVTTASAVGPSMGISADGVFDLVNKRMDIRGVISPLYMLNGLGQILTRNREGLFGFNYRMRGPVSAPRTTVNPLSILTPGIFREIFRAPIPEPGQ